MIPAHVHQILQHHLLISQLAIVVLAVASVLLLLVLVELLQLLVNLLCVHLIDVDVRCVLVQVRCLQCLDMHLVFQGTQLELVELLSGLSSSATFLVWELLGLDLVQEIAVLGRHISFLGVQSDGVRTQARAVVPVVLREHHIRVTLIKA